jgi:hypothetical protein
MEMWRAGTLAEASTPPSAASRRRSSAEVAPSARRTRSHAPVISVLPPAGMRKSWRTRAASPIGLGALTPASTYPMPR